MHVCVTLAMSALTLLQLLIFLDVVSAQYRHHVIESKAQLLRGVDIDHKKFRSLQRGNVGSVISWRLINATFGNQGEVLLNPLLNETIIDLASYPPNQKFSIEVITSNNNGPVGSVRFQFDGKNNFRTERNAPWALCGNTNKNFVACPNKLVNIGTTTVGATPYSLKNGEGVKGVQNKLSFRVINTATTPNQPPANPPMKIPANPPVKVPANPPMKVPANPPRKSPINSPTNSGDTVGSVVSWRLINATSGNQGEVLLDPLLNETVIDLANYPPNQKFSIEAITSNNGPIGSVRFQFDGDDNFRTDRIAPWALCGNKNKNYFACPNKLVAVGTTTVGATPFSRTKGTGIKGIQNNLSFRVINTTSTPTYPVCEADNEIATQCCSENGLVIPEESCCPIGDDVCCGKSLQECIGVLFAFQLETVGVTNNSDIVPPIFFTNNDNFRGCPLGVFHVSTLNGGTFEYTNTETILSNAVLQSDNSTEVIFTPEELEVEQRLDIEYCLFLGTTGAASFLGLASISTDPNTGNHFGYLFIIDDPEEVNLSELRTSGNERNLQSLSCESAVNTGVALITCDNGQAPEISNACVSAAITACNTDVENAILVYNIAEAAAIAAYNTAIVVATALKIQKYRKALIICSLVGVLSGPLNFALCMATQVLIAEALFFAAKEIAKSLLDDTIALAIQERDRIIAAATSVARAAGRACGTCPCDTEGDPNCCESDDPCCDNEDPCCGSEDPCCGSEDPCCGSEDPCCGSSDPCCGSSDPCCGSSDPCCGVDCDGGGANGDPHMFTFDNLRYSCQAKGEFIIFEAMTSGAMVQSRFEKKGSFVSLATGVALRESLESTVVQLSLSKEQSNVLDLLVGGRNVTLEGYEDADVKVSQSFTTYTIQFKESGLNVVVNHIKLPSFPHLSINVRTPPRFRDEEVRGLLGSPDSNALNDWMSTDGSVIDISSSVGDEEAQYEYCLNWCIRTNETSLFVYQGNFTFEFFSGCDDPYAGTVDISLASTQLQALCGMDQACLIDGIELGIDGAQSLLESEANLSQQSGAARFRSDPANIVVGESVNVVLTVNLTGLDASVVEEYLVYRFSAETLTAGTTAIISLQDTGTGLGEDIFANDQVYSGVVATLSGSAGESFSFQAVPVIGGTPDSLSPFAFVGLNAVRSFSRNSGIGVGTNLTTFSLFPESIEGLVLTVVYSWPADQSDLDTGTSFLDFKAGFGCGPASEYLLFSGDDTNAGGTETVDVLLGASFNDEAWSETSEVVFAAGWYQGRGLGPASITVSTKVLESNGTFINSNDAVSFVVNPGAQSGCSSTVLGSATVTVSNNGSVNITVQRIV